MPLPFDYSKPVAMALREGAAVHDRLAEACGASIARAASVATDSLRLGGQLLLFGNGGSAADAQHLAAELTGRFQRERPALAAVALTTDTSALTAIGNDYGFERTFARQVEALGRPGDVALAFSTSGNSPNVLAAAEAAHARGLTVIGFTGESGGQLAALADVAVVVPSTVTARIQEAHIALGHAFCEAVEDALSGDSEAVRAPLNRDLACGVVEWTRLLELRAQWRAQGCTVVWTNGCFDLLHIGHVRSLEAARALGDVLIVGVNSDASVQALKGPGRPLVPHADRAAVLAALRPVTAVVVFDEATPEHALERLQPEIHCKGADYAPPNGKPVPEAAVVEAYGGRVAYLPLVPGRSTTGLVEQLGRPDA